MRKFIKLYGYFCILLSVLLFFSCSKSPELYLSEIEALAENDVFEMLEKTKSKPWNGEDFVDGVQGGTWYDSITSDPKTFNQLIANRDGSSYAIVGFTTDYLIGYNPLTREWEANIANYKILQNEDGSMIVRFTMRDDAYWTYQNSDKKIPVTSDDFVFWYNEIEGDDESGLSSYATQFMEMPDGSLKHVDVVALDDKNFEFRFPTTIADPLLRTNRRICPSFIYRPAKEKGGMDGVKKLFGINCDPKTIPSCGRFYITEYIPSRRLVYTRNPYYWDKDKNGISIPYYDQMIVQIVGDQNTNYLLFKQGLTESYSLNASQLSEVVDGQGSDYTVFRSEGSMGAAFWTFNQNPKNKESPFYEWFCKKEFRQAMSCLLNRERIINQTYRGLASSTEFFFPPTNPFYNKDITLKYLFNPKKAEKLLTAAGFIKKDGIFYDWENRRVEFDLSITPGTATVSDIAQIISDEAEKIGIKINIRQVDFQKMVEDITSEFNWQSLIIGLGINNFPTQGSNTWPSYGDMHIWYPKQPSPATEWEARIDELYKKGSCTIERAEAEKIWDEYQSIILEQCPIIYLCRPKAFVAIRNKWDFSNFYYDNINGAEATHIFIRAE